MPLSIAATAGQRHDSTQLESVLDAIRAPRATGVGRPGKRPDRAIADKGYSHTGCRTWLRGRRIPHTIPERRDQRERRKRHPGRKPGLDREVYRSDVVERCANKLKQWRAVAARYDKRALNYRAGVIIAALMLRLAA